MAYTTVNKPRDYFNNMMYNGNNVDDNQIDGVGFKPATLWIKDMDRGSNHVFTTTCAVDLPSQSEHVHVP